MVKRSTVLLIVAIAAIAGLAAWQSGLLLTVSSQSCYLSVVTTSTNPPTVDALIGFAGGTCSDISTAIRNGDVVMTHFEWGDGTATDVRGAEAPGIRATHVYAQIGVYTVTATVDHSDGSPFHTFTATANLNVPLEIDWSYQQASGTKTVQFSATVNGGVPPYNYNWDFGDGSTMNVGTGSISHTYANYGTYNVKLQVTDSSTPFQTKLLGKSVTLNGPAPLSTQFTCNADGWTVSCAASASGGVSPYSFSWDFGDTYPPGTIGHPNLASGQYATHTYPASGTYTVTLTATDANSPPSTASAQQAVTVTQGPGGCTTDCPPPPTPQPPTPINLQLVLEIVIIVFGAALLFLGIIKRNLILLVVGVVIVFIGLSWSLIMGLL